MPATLSAVAPANSSETDNSLIDTINVATKVIVPVAEQQEVLVVSGRRPLSGHVTISGAKNSALAIMAGALLSQEPLRLFNVPELGDVKRMGQILASMGCKVSISDDQDEAQALCIDPSTITSTCPPPDLVAQLRASFFVIGSLVGRCGEARVPLPGGCNIGMRPVELHLRGLQTLGATVELEHGVVHAVAPKGGLQGAQIFLDYPSVGATETLMMAACYANGETIIQNAAREPEVIDLANFCIALGAKITGAGTGTIVIQGVKKMHGCDYTIIPDRIEAGTMLVAGAMTNSEITMGPVIPSHLSSVISKIEETGCRVVEDTPDTLRLVPAQRLRAIDIKTLPYAGFPTDMQAQFMALTTVCKGRSVITETVFENRMQHAAELARMGGNIKVEGNVAIVTGVEDLSGARVTATDLRASAALVLAGLAAEGTTILQKLHHLDRGYDRFDLKLQKLGAAISRRTENVPPPR
eukprot:tig00021037_g17414.t1